MSVNGIHGLTGRSDNSNHKHICLHDEMVSAGREGLDIRFPQPEVHCPTCSIQPPLPE